MSEQNSSSDSFKKERKSQDFPHRLRWLFNTWPLANKSWKTHLVSILLLLTTLVVAFGATIFIRLARAEKGVQDQYNRTIGLRKIYQNVITKASIVDMRICACEPDRKERVTLPGGFETTVSIYDPGGVEPKPGIVLIHGNVWMGQRLSTYRVVANSLKERGFIVLTFDKLGFGESDDPFRHGPVAVAAAHDNASQVEIAVDYLLKHTNVDPHNITLLGHSGGVTEAFELGQKLDQVATVVAWVAPFAPADEYEVQANLYYLNDKFHARYELVYGQSVPDWFSWEMAEINSQDPDVIWEYYRQQNHKPLIIVLGEYDQPDAHHSVFDNFELLSEPKKLVFIRRADHYLNTAQSLRWVFYDKEIVDELVSELTSNLNPEQGNFD